MNSLGSPEVMRVVAGRAAFVCRVRACGSASWYTMNDCEACTQVFAARVATLYHIMRRRRRRKLCVPNDRRRRRRRHDTSAKEDRNM